MDLSSDESEDWFMESLLMYKDLHVFQLEFPTKVIEWTGDKRICVASYSSAKSELLELLLPLKLYAKGNQGLCPERDFKVLHGGFSDEPVECLKYIGKRCVVTSGPQSSKLLIWDIGDEDSDVIRRTGILNCSQTSSTCRRIARGLTEELSVLHGSQIRDVQLTEVGSGRTLYTAGTDASDMVSGLQVVNANTFVVCANNGTLYTGDTRAPTIKHDSLPDSTSALHWAFGVTTGGTEFDPVSDPASCTVARLSSSGHVIVSDLRNLSAPVKQAALNVQRVSTSDVLSVTWAPALDNYLAVSGFDGSVQIFDTTSWSSDSQNPRPVFVHRGHKLSCERNISDTPLVVTTHVWHPLRPRTLLSAASDGSLHVWDWVEKSS